MSEEVSKRKEVVGVRLTSSQLDIVDSLVDAGLFKTRSEVTYWFISEGLRTIPLEKLSTRLEELRNLKSDAIGEMRRGMRDMRESYYEVFGEGYIHPSPESGKIGWGTGLITTPIGKIGLDWDKIQIVMHGGRVRLPRENGSHSEEERKIMKAALPELSRMAGENEIERAELLKQKLETAIQEKA